MMDITYTPYIDPDFEFLLERIHPPRVSVDNDIYPDCSLIMVDSANKHGVLLEMVQVLTDLDLLISKSYISSDGGWLMDVFHVTDQQGYKLTDQNLIHQIQEAICKSRLPNKEARPRGVSADHVAFEMTGLDRPGLMSEMSAVLAEMDCHISAAVAWTHKGRAACIIYVEDTSGGKAGRMTDPARAAQVRSHLENVVEAHHHEDERHSVTLASPCPHTERRLHQLMAADRDYDQCCSCCNGNSEWDGINVYGGCRKEQRKGQIGTHVKIQRCKETGYSIVTVRSRDRPKLLFDTVCALTDLNYVVHHAAIGSQGSTAFQEYYVTDKNGTLETDSEKHRVTKCLVAATERRVSHGLRLKICTKNRTGLLSDVTRVLRENGLSITGAEIGTRGENAVGTFYLKDATGEDVSPETVEVVRRELGGRTVFENVSPGTSPEAMPSRTSSGEEERTSFSLRGLIWSQLEWLSGNFKPT
ncbi:ACT domain-containing protein ACR1 [Salvia hispanica]|uniref:ACT domain-containing protein ACR1 n=1 Tax=Salvia hispanica TaxID=49212 RepID=UPI0020095EE8|nr:ACT domain-containing protein ACR1 [Salvia hispanica]XP_047958220.1 ACT domain-containing protein ACR1 [Salvia hispanica]XP_047958227.1 ACT domain-containing protein ACR1 [Salvia hispanica]XP_047958236.1 ACT domain-containing protein ACR1 [Salvia hispanica]XP_047958246.1 ACT domain-containing protein ACR1 [Salvia hispanica]